MQCSLAIAGWLVLALSISAGHETYGDRQTAAAQQQPVAARDALPHAMATAVVRGRVTSAATGAPLHRVRVTLNGPVPNPPTAVTDTRGAFELTNVQAGSYSLTAVRAGYLTIQYGQRRPREAGRTLEIQSGHLLERIDIALYRGGVLAGRITDELGDPSPAARVEAIEFRYIRGRRVAVPARVALTNDAGDYRLSGLEPGTYQIRASTVDVWEADDGKTTHAYALTYYPGVAGTDQPQTINVSVGQEVSSLDFRLIAGRAARITGVVESASGEPLPAQAVNMDRITRTVGGALLSAGFGGSTRTDARGAFEFPKLAPGEYMVYSGSQTERTSARAIVGGGDLRHVVLTPRRAAAVAGSIVTEDDSAPSFPAARVRVSAIGADPESVLPVWGAPGLQTPRSDWTFRIPNADGQYLFRATGMPDDWMLKAVTLGGRDITDVALPVARGGPDIEGLRIVVSPKGAKLAGLVADGAGAPAPDSTVIVFAENRAMWGLSSRFIRAARPGASGRFSIGGLPPAVYRAIARDYVLEGQWEDPEFLQGLLKEAARVELGEGASETIKLTLEQGR